MSDSPEASPSARSGLFNSIKRLLATLIEIVSTRLELLVVELEEERAWLGSLLVWTLVALFCGALGIVLAILLVIVYFWDSHRLLAFSAVTGVFLLGALFSWRVVVNKIRTKPRLFSSSMAAMRKDQEQLNLDPHERKTG